MFILSLNWRCVVSLLPSLIFSLGCLTDKDSNLHRLSSHWPMLPCKFSWTCPYRWPSSLSWGLLRDRWWPSLYHAGLPSPTLRLRAELWIKYCGVVHRRRGVYLDEPNFIIVVYHEVIADQLTVAFSSINKALTAFNGPNDDIFHFLL